MFHVKQQWRRALPLLLLSLVVLGCGGAAGASGWAPPVRSEDTLLVATDRGQLEAIDAESGAILWRFPDQWLLDKSADDLEGLYSPPVLAPGADNGAIYLGDYNGRLYIFDPADLDRAAPAAGFVDLGDKIIGGLALDEATDTLFVTSGDRLVALKASDLLRPSQLPEIAQYYRFQPFQTTGELWGPPVVGDDDVFVASLDGNLYAIDRLTGAESWRFEAAAALVSAPVVAGDTVLVGGFNSRLYAIDVANGEERWSFKAANWVWSRPVVAGGNLYLADFDGNLHGLSLETGLPLWEPFGAKGRVRAGIALVDDVLIVATEDGAVYGVDSRTGALSWGPVELGASVLADVVGDGAFALIVSAKCTNVEIIGGKRKINYFRVDVATGAAEPVLAQVGC